MNKISITLLLLIGSISALTLPAFSSSSIRVLNNSSEPLQAIWQAGGCAGVKTDWAGDSQYTVCEASVVYPGEIKDYDFNTFLSDRSMKVFASLKEERIGYCNSMDDETLTITDDGNDNFTSSGC